MNSPIKFSKENFWKAQEVLFFCVSEEYENEDMSYEEFRQLLKKHRETGVLENSMFKVDLRSNLLIDLYEEED